MGGSDWAAIFVALISIISAIFSGRSARTAAKYNSDASVMNSRTQAETEAYNRARKMDIETIERQDKDIEELRLNSEKLRERVRLLMQDNERLREDNGRLHEENQSLLRRVDRLEKQQGERCE